MGTIVSMAQDYVGSNGINLLEPCGQFGTRLQMGKDAASARYIFTKLRDVAFKLFPKEDDAVLKYLDDDGQSIEPEYYAPTLPMVLINGAEGIGTGYSTFVPQYNPDDIKNVIKQLINKEPPGPIKPWYKNFTGNIEEKEPQMYTMHGVYKMSTRSTLEVTELPIGRATDDYKEFLESLIDTTIESYENHSTETKVHFKIRVKESIMDSLKNEDKIEKEFKLTTSISEKNMHLFDANNVIKKYETPVQIIEDFFKTKVQFLKKRKEHIIDELSKKANLASEKARFIKMVNDDIIAISKRKKVDIIKDLEKHKFNESLHDQLLGMKIDSLTHEKQKELEHQRDVLLKSLEDMNSTTIKPMFLNDLNNIK
jgi:DNA topoisomerase-2